MDLFVQSKTNKGITQNKRFSLFIYKIAVVDSRINFKDKTLPTEFSKTADNLNLVLRLSLPLGVKFNLNSDIVGESRAKIIAVGEYKISQRELKTRVSIKDFAPQDFSGYYQNFGIAFTQGTVDSVLDIKFQEDIIYADLEARSKDLTLSKNRVQAQINLDTKSHLQYSLKENQLIFSGSADIAKLDISGLEFPDKVNDIKGRLNFNNAGFSFDIFNATLKIEKLKSPLENISGRIDFSPDQLKWPELNFQYLGVRYKTEGSLNNFKAPEVQLRLSSPELFLESNFGLTGKLIKFSKLDGRYLNSDFVVKGDMDITDPSSLEANINLGASIDLEDLKGPLKKFKDNLEKIKPSGIVETKMNLTGNINDIKACLIKANLSSPSLSAYGLKSGNFSLDYRQENGLMDIPLMHFSCYDGTIDLNARMNLLSEDLPYWINVNIQDLKLEKLKLDTALKGKDIAGTLGGEAKINSFYKDVSRMTGAGRLSVLDGKLWELNLFQGLGKLLFAKDFASINIKEGNCDFLIQDRSIFTNNLTMKGEFIDLSGNMKIGFDSSIEASLNVHVDDRMVPLSGTLKDVTTAIIGEAGRFGVIKISGTLKEPKYKFQTLALDILKALKDTFFGK
jgi:hypothetical protein